MSEVIISGEKYKNNEITITIPETVIEYDNTELEDFYAVDFLINNKQYNLESKLPYHEEMIISRKKEILGEMDLEEVIHNLDLCADLLHLAYNGVAGEKQIQSKLSHLQSDLADLCSDAKLTMTVFKNECQKSLNNIIEVFQNIINCEEQEAIELLIKCGKSAEKMANKAKELANKFQLMGDTTQSALEETMERRNIRNEEREKIVAERKDMLTQLKSAAKKFDDLTEEIQETAEDLMEAKAEASAAAERELILGLTTAVANAAGGIASGIIAGYTAQGKVMSSLASNLTQVEKEVGEQKKELEKKVKTANKEKEKAEEKEATATKEVRDLEEKKEKIVKEKESDTLSEKAYAKKMKNLDKKLENAKNKLASAVKENNASKNALDAANNAFSDGMDKFTKQMDKQQEAAKSMAENARKEVNELRKRKAALRKEKRELLGNISTFSESIKNAHTDEDIIKITIASLNQAIMALSKVVVALKSATTFWKALQEYCNGLATPQFQSKLEKFAKKSSIKLRLRQYYKPLFIFQAVDYIVRWKALHEICEAYEIEAEKARVKVLDNIDIKSIENASIRGARKLAPILAEKLLGYISNEEDRYNEEEEREIKETNKLLQEIDELINRPTPTNIGTVVS